MAVLFTALDLESKPDLSFKVKWFRLLNQSTVKLPFLREVVRSSFQDFIDSLGADSLLLTEGVYFL